MSTDHASCPARRRAQRTRALYSQATNTRIPPGYPIAYLLPRTADTTEGFFSRWVVVPFTGFFPAGVADTTLIGRLTSQANLQGLLRMAVGGLQGVMRRQQFALPSSVARATERFKAEADPLRGFIGERVKCVRESDARPVPRTDVYAAYTTWAVVNGFHQMSASRFYESFVAAVVGGSRHGFRDVTLNGTRVYRGIKMAGS